MTEALHHRIGPLLRLSALLAGILAFEIMYGPLMPEDPQASSGRTEKPVDSLSDTPLQSPAISTFAEIVSGHFSLNRDGQRLRKTPRWLRPR